MIYPEYKYRDVAIGGVEHRNNIVEIDNIPKLISRSPYECYTTLFRFTQDFKDYVERTKSVGGYLGKAFTDFLPFDIDVENENINLAIKEALRQARWFVAVLITEFGLQGEQFKYYFSGRKGFHILIPTKAFNCQPLNGISYVFKKMATLVSKKAGIDIDKSIYDLVRLFRYPNTKHKKSGLYKIPLSYEEFNKLSYEDILSLAKKPHKVEIPGLEETDIFSDILYQRYLEFIGDLSRPKQPVVNEAKIYPIPPRLKLCYYKIMQGIEEGERDDCALRLSIYLKKLGYPSNISLGALLGWNQRNNPPLESDVVEKKVEQAYNNNYSYSCNDYILQKYCDTKCYLKKEKEKSAEDIKSIEELIVEYQNYVANLSQNLVHLGLGNIDRIMRGIAPGEICEIIGIPTSGKTCLAINILHNVSIHQGISSLFFSLEQPAVQVFEREASISMEKTGQEVENIVKTGKLNGYVSRIISDFKNVYVCDKDNLTLRDMKDYIMMLQDKIEKHVGFIVIDYLGLVGGTFGSSYEIITALTRQIKSFAKEMNLAVLFIHHVSVKKKGIKDPITLSDARDSSVAVDAADFLMGMWRPKPMEIQIRLLKSRKSGEVSECFRFIPDKMTIQLLEREKKEANEGRRKDVYD